MIYTARVLRFLSRDKIIFCPFQFLDPFLQRLDIRPDRVPPLIYQQAHGQSVLIAQAGEQIGLETGGEVHVSNRFLISSIEYGKSETLPP